MPLISVFIFTLVLQLRNSEIKTTSQKCFIWKSRLDTSFQSYIDYAEATHFTILFLLIYISSFEVPWNVVWHRALCHCFTPAIMKINILREHREPCIPMFTSHFGDNPLFFFLVPCNWKLEKQSFLRRHQSIANGRAK